MSVPHIVVLGSLNVDLISAVGELPRNGQTIFAESFVIENGGKGANQAVAAKRTQVDVQLVCAVGDDEFGQKSLSFYQSESIDINYSKIIPHSPSGIALINIDTQGQNAISVAPGANSLLKPQDIENIPFANFDIILSQLETPIDTIEAIAQNAKKHSRPFILNPAPVHQLSISILCNTYCLTPNETEAEHLSGIQITDLDSAKKAAQVIHELGPKNIIITMGAKGALLYDGTAFNFSPAPQVTVKDTTAAGDTFNGVLAALLARKMPLENAFEYAIKAASITVQKKGATCSIPFITQWI